ncbi:MAG: M20/M25/M40 family metallo-hydrolase [Methanobacteriota archaeon]|nr:MAG: M20/M25/M40 family metallo-hydrolase [Euryarchaeota archaeon]
MSVLLREAESLLGTLVKLRSSREDEALPLAAFVTERLEGLGLEPGRYGDSDRPAIFASHGDDGVVLSGHLDTVPLGSGWTRGQGEVVDGRMYGRGTCDMKGGCAAILLAAEQLVKDGVPFSVCLTLDEEISMNGALAVAQAHLLKDAPAVLVAEPTNFDVVVREKGLIQFSIKTGGKSAHASTPALGENDVAKMIAVLGRMGDLAKVPDDPMEDLTVCVDVVRGGSEVNVIPDSCEAHVDSRFPPDMSGDDVLSAVRGRLGDSGYELKVMHLLEPVGTDPELPAVTTLHEIVGPDAHILGVPYATEMVMFKEDNSTLMVCGPGEPEQAHMIDEWIDVSSIPKGVDVYVRYCKRMTDL